MGEGVEVIRQAISCDICGAEKKQTNHWFVAYEQAGELRVSGWNSRNRLKADSKHLCGQACLHKLADDFMARVIGEKSAARPQANGEELEMEPAPAPIAEKHASTGSQTNALERAHSRNVAEAHPLSPTHPVVRPVAYDRATVQNTFEDIEVESSARLITAAEPANFETTIQLPGPRLPLRPAGGVVPMSDRAAAAASHAGPVALPVSLPAEPQRYASYHWRAEAWERERERSLRSNDHRSGDHRSEHVTRRISQA